MSNSAHTIHNRIQAGDVVPIVLPYHKQRVVSSSSQEADWRWLPLALPDSLLALCQPLPFAFAEWLVAAFGAYVARLGRTKRFDLGFRDSRVSQKGQISPYLPLRLDMNGVETFDALLQQVQTELRGLVNFASLADMPAQERWSVAVEYVECLQQWAEERLADDVPAFTMLISEREHACYWLYNAQMFDLADIEAMQAQFSRVLADIAQNPSVRLGELRLLSIVERYQLLFEFNDNAVHYGPPRCLHELFEQQVARTPTAEALVWGNERLSYEELNRQANQLANDLREVGVRPGILVGISVTRSIEMVLAILGVLKAGGAYVPLDPAYPKERLAFIINDTQTPLLLTQKALLDRLPENAQDRLCFYFDKDWDLIALVSDQNPMSEVTADNLGYVIYTSGSTGRPKGVAIEHRSAVALIDWALDFFKQPKLDAQSTGLFRGTLFSTSICFDLSIFELFMPLSCGGKVILAENALELPTLPAKDEVTLINTVPSAIAGLVRLNGIPTSVEAVILAGEPLKTSLVGQIYAHPHIKQVFDLYGPSEDTTYSTHALRSASGKATIGRPIANTQLYLLDQYLQPVPLGVPGQIYLGGEGLARGYLNRPDLTAERFIPNPFGTQVSTSFGSCFGSRLYNTGDLARYRPDGNLEFLGRVDHQVKIRGYRIELGEIEAALMRHAAIRETVVVAHETPKGDKQLVAYVLPETLSLNDHEARTAKAQAEQLIEWQAVWDKTYREQTESSLFHSWNSSYDEQPIPAKEMQEWLDYIVERVLSLQPKRVLELGCGTGLLLFEIAPYTLQYWASDFSRVSLTYIQQQIDQLSYQLPQVKLFEAEANDFTPIGQQKFDLILINSVVQYFPTMAYLLNVLEQAVKAVQPGGAILIGDVRHLGLLDAFHASVVWHKAPDSLTKAEFKKQVEERVAQEEELLIDPAFFEALRAYLPQITHVDIQLKHGRSHNELTRFRYDVLLHVGPIPHHNRAAGTDADKLDWQQNQLSLEGLYQTLRDKQPSHLLVTNVPNPRLMTEHHLIAWLRNDNGAQTVGEFRDQLAEQLKGQTVIEPEELWAFAYNLPYLVEVTWASSGEIGYYDVCFTRYQLPTLPGEANGYMPARIHRATSQDQQVKAIKAWHEYGNNPLQAQQKRQLIPQLRHYLQQSLPDYMVPALFMMLDALPLTPNGKVNRRALPKPELSRAKLGDSTAAPRNKIETQLAQIWCDVLGIADVGIHDNFFELGGDSILNIRILAKANQVGLRLTPKQLWQHQTIADLANVARLTPSIQAEQGIVTGDVPLTAYYHWFFEQQFADAHHWNMPLLFEVHQPLQQEPLEQTIDALLTHHDALRMRFTHTESGWQASIAHPNLAKQAAQSDQTVSSQKMGVNAIKTSEVSHREASHWETSEVCPRIIEQVLWVDLSHLPINKQLPAMQQRAGELQASLNLSNGPLVKVAYFQMGDEQPDYLLFIIHHLVVDGVSWLILLEDFQTAYQQLVEGKPVQLPRKSTSFQKWANYPRDYVQSGALEQETDYWLDIAKESRSDDFRGCGSALKTTEVVTTHQETTEVVTTYQETTEVVTTHQETTEVVTTHQETTEVVTTYQDNTVASSHIITQTLTKSETEQLLREVPTAYNTQINDVLLTALLLGYHKWSGQRSLLIDLEGHGREEITQEVDLSRTVSGFTTIFPVPLTLTHPAEELGNILIAIKEQLRAIPQRGMGYGLLRYLHPDEHIREQLRKATPAQLIFNYLGQFDQILPDASLFTLSRVSHGPIYSPRSQRTHLIEINGFVANEQLHLEWTYSQAYHHEQTIQQFAAQFMHSLRALITHCQAPESGRYTASDFAEAELNQEELEELLRELGEL